MRSSAISLMVEVNESMAWRLLGVETGMDVEDAAQVLLELASTDVGGDHRLFRHAVGDAAASSTTMATTSPASFSLKA